MNRKLWVIVVVSLVLVAALVLPACAQPAPAPKPSTPTPAPAPAPVAAKIIKFAYTVPKGASVGAGFEWFAQEFPKRTNGRYAVETYPNNNLIGMSAALDSVKAGVADIVQTSTGTFPKDFSLSLVVSIPAYSFPGGAVSSYVEGGDAIWELYNAIPEIQTEYSKVKLLWPIMLSPYNIVSKKKEIRAPTDFQGIKVGGSGAKMELVNANGGAKVQMIPPDSYLSLEKGVVEAAFLTISQVHDFKIFEICDYFYAQDFGGGCMINLMNLNSWNSMASQDQKIMMDVWREVNVESAKGSLTNENLGKKEIEAAGKKITVPTKEEIAGWEKGAEVAVTSWKNDAKALGTPEAVLDRIFAKWKEVRAPHLAKVK